LCAALPNIVKQLRSSVRVAPLIVEPAVPDTSSPLTDRREPRISPLRVAFVDDDVTNCRLGLRFLSMLGVRSENIFILRDGALEAVTRACFAH
jgi:hypothetical protein